MIRYNPAIFPAAGSTKRSPIEVSLNETVDSIQAASASPAAAERATARIFERRTVMSAAVDLASPEQIIAYLADCFRLRRGCSVVFPTSESMARAA